MNHTGFIKRDKTKGNLASREPLFTSFRKKQDAKRMWKKDRATIMSGIKQFHKSTAGKQLHRKMNRFMSGEGMSRVATLTESFNKVEH